MIKKATLNYSIVFICLAIYFVFVVTGIKEFDIWNQITDIISEPSIGAFVSAVANMVLNKHAHLFRLILVFPVLLAAEVLSIDSNYLFSLVLWWLISMMSLMLMRLSSYVRQSSPALWSPLLLIGVSIFMNGRGVLGLFGITLIIYNFYRNTEGLIGMKKFFFMILTGCFFCSVSSGVFSVSLCSVMLFFILKISRDFPVVKKMYLKLIGLFGLTLVALIPEMKKLIQKNLDFYGGSFIEMINHGVGNVVSVSFVLTIAAILFLVSPIIFVKIRSLVRQHPVYLITFPAIFASSTIGVFGFLTLFICLPAVLVLIDYSVYRLKIGPRSNQATEIA